MLKDIKTRPHVVIAVATFKDVPIEFLETMVSLVAYTQSQGFLVTFAYSQRTHRNMAREELVKTAKDLMADWVFFLDDDMTVPQNIIADLAKHDVPIVSGLAFTRKEPITPVILLNKYSTDSEGVIHESYKTWYDYPVNQLTEVSATGLACCLVRNDVLDVLSEYCCTAREGESEDIKMIREARKKGFKVYVDTALKVGHMQAERRIITEKDYDRDEYRDHFANLA